MFMRKMILCMVGCLFIAFSHKATSADVSGSLNNEVRAESYISSIYKQIDFGKSGRLSYEAFSKAYYGYLNLRNAGKVNADKEIITVCDFSMPSSENRMWIIDLKQKKVLLNTYVAHGQGSGDDYPHIFSNKFNSHQSSLGFYITADIYDGEHGTSLRLQGMDEGFNDAAYDRGIVVHGADYVCDKFVNANQRLGRSWGCPAVPGKLSLSIINTIKDGTCLFIYYPESKYMKTSYWLNKKLAYLPKDNMYSDITPADIIPGATQKPATRVIQYISNGKVDSVKILASK
jgi:hypothetical protein